LAHEGDAPGWCLGGSARAANARAHDSFYTVWAERYFAGFAGGGQRSMGFSGGVTEEGYSDVW